MSTKDRALTAAAPQPGFQAYNMDIAFIKVDADYNVSGFQGIAWLWDDVHSVEKIVNFFFGQIEFLCDQVSTSYSYRS